MTALFGLSTGVWTVVAIMGDWVYPLLFIATDALVFAWFYQALRYKRLYYAAVLNMELEGIKYRSLMELIDWLLMMGRFPWESDAPGPEKPGAPVPPEGSAGGNL